MWFGFWEGVAAAEIEGVCWRLRAEAPPSSGRKDLATPTNRTPRVLIASRQSKLGGEVT